MPKQVLFGVAKAAAQAGVERNLRKWPPPLTPRVGCFMLFGKTISVYKRFRVTFFGPSTKREPGVLFYAFFGRKKPNLRLSRCSVRGLFISTAGSTTWRLPGGSIVEISRTPLGEKCVVFSFFDFLDFLTV